MLGVGQYFGLEELLDKKMRKTTAVVTTSKAALYAIEIGVHTALYHWIA